jgi:hypothetical protein
MSRTYDLACHTCQVKLWVGQAPIGERSRFSIYTTDGDGTGAAALSAFLIGHEHHRLEFADDEAFCEDYKQLDRGEGED